MLFFALFAAWRETDLSSYVFPAIYPLLRVFVPGQTVVRMKIPYEKNNRNFLENA
mgnify:CR=1 FL=1